MLGLQLPLEQRRAVRHYEVVVAFNPRDGSVVSVDPATGARDMAIPALLQRTWGHGDFGVYAKVETGGRIGTGDTVTVLDRVPVRGQR